MGRHGRGECLVKNDSADNRLILFTIWKDDAADEDFEAGSSGSSDESSGDSDDETAVGAPAPKRAKTSAQSSVPRGVGGSASTAPSVPQSSSTIGREVAPYQGRPGEYVGRMILTRECTDLATWRLRALTPHALPQCTRILSTTR